MPKTDNRSCTCGAVYRRVEATAAAREIGSYVCAVCGATLESWNTAWVPSYRLIVGPIRKPE
jgi:predicted SprT family Zn-dependent metalloprotease